METRKLESTDIKATVRNFIVQNFLFGVDNKNLTDSASFLETGIIDSTGILELITYIESEFGVEILDAEMIPANLDSLDNLSAFIIKKTSN